MVKFFAKKFFGRVGGWVGLQLVEDVPDEITACEFDCSRTDCEGDELIGCGRRIRAEAAAGRSRAEATAGGPTQSLKITPQG